ncbi:membrane-bound transcription factor site-2 protease-like isoform X2 [Corticium candelabrum]|uniref:membrane-bound transcription factor site-2 protease-like isoform X2 n=1 Tax=Corticium candelabrum TaxID=121492 RepID=UPI002E25FF96|nr:membrane-bound transcription factor site-2 protease-like isoform X2 [Corticium candelabrum]
MWVAWTVPAVWLLLAVIDRVVKRKGRQRYRLFLERYGLSVSLGRIQFYTNRVNHLLVRFSDFFPRRWLQAWFTVGVVIGLVLIPLSVGVLVFTLRSFIVSSDEEARDPLLVPVLPGVNLPWSQLVYFLVTIAVSGVLHELGHAVAAVSENVHIDGVGLFFFVMYPGAFVDLHTQHVTTLNSIQKLRIFCAGVWHNVIIVFVCLLALYCLPWILFPLFTSTQGAVVNGISKNSPVYNNLVVGSVILSVDGQSVHSKADWMALLSKISQHGFCANKSSLKRMYTRAVSLSLSGVVECCQNESLSDFCFHSSEPLWDTKKVLVLHSGSFSKLVMK